MLSCVGLQVLHEDGKWYDGQLTEFSAETSKWHILFDDGDKDWYSLPDRCAHSCDLHWALLINTAWRDRCM